MIITLVFTFPIPLNMGSVVIGRPYDDVLEGIWYLDWYKYSLFDSKVSPLFQPDIFYPTGWDLRLASLPPLYPTLLSPLTFLLGSVVVYNFVLLLSCVISALGSYQLARSLGASMLGGILAGIGFAFYPNRQVYFSGFLNFLLGSMWIPWMLYALVRAENEVKYRTVWITVAGIAFALSVAGAWPLAFITGGTGVVFGISYLSSNAKYEAKKWLPSLLIGITVTSAILVPLISSAYLARQNLGSAAEFRFDTHVDPTSVSLERLFVPSALNPLTWDLARNTFPLTNGEDGVVSFGYTIMMLAIVMIFRGRFKDRRTRSLILTAFVGVVFMLGTTLHVMGKPILVGGGLSDILARFVPIVAKEHGKASIPLPALSIYLLVPAFRSFHHFGRWGLTAAVSLSTLAGLGLTHIMKVSVSWKRSLIGMGCIMLLLFEFNTQPLPVTTNINEIEREVDTWLAMHSDQGTIIEYPLRYSLSAQTLYYTTFHKQRIVHGYSSLAPSEFSMRRELLEEWPSSKTVEHLRSTGVKYVLVNVFDEESFLSSIFPQVIANDHVDFIRRFSDTIGPVSAIYLFGIVP